MKSLSETFAAMLAAEITTLCACWRLERRDGQVFGATDHDRTISFSDLDFVPVHSLASARLESGAELAPGRAAVDGALNADFIREADLAAGLWDGARVDVWRVDWTDPDLRLRVWSGRMSEVSRSGAAFAAELVSLKADLEKPVGRVYARTCDAEVGDARCGVDLDTVAYRGWGEITEVLGEKRYRASGLSAFETSWFAGGMLSWSSGANAGSTRRVVRHVAGVAAEIELALAPRNALAVGDTFWINAGCARDFSTCGVKFANQIRFRGFPHMPGMDAVLAGPASDRANTGGRRA